MNFRLIKDAIVTLLEAEAAGRFRVAGYQRKRISALTVEDGARLVSVYYKTGDFPKSGGAMNGPTAHEMTFQIDIDVSKRAQADLISHDAFENSSELADASFDEVVDAVYQILMDARNQSFGLDLDVVADRWISTVQKDEPSEYGEFAIVTGGMVLTCKTDEQVPGEEGTEMTEGIDLILEADGDSAKAGVLVVPEAP
jgi:hypothetical protein